ncbi:MAG TPA: hypothetical protein VHH73_18315 [Verrucomicrobiae bacterium]|nr:hypothetical protein [Verrucomicrobiae bacterium]
MTTSLPLAVLALALLGFGAWVLIELLRNLSGDSNRNPDDASEMIDPIDVASSGIPSGRDDSSH